MELVCMRCTIVIWLTTPTGMVKLVSMEVVEKYKEDTFSSCKKLIRTTIPEG